MPRRATWLVLFGAGCAGSRQPVSPGLDCERLAAQYQGSWASPPDRVPTQKLVDGPILGNGDLGIVLGGPPEKLTFYIGLNSFWAVQVPRVCFPVSCGGARRTNGGHSDVARVSGARRCGARVPSACAPSDDVSEGVGKPIVAP